MDAQESLENEWPYLLSFLPPEETLEATARSCGAIQRRRAVAEASTLLRLALVYGFCGFSLRQTAAWAEAADIASLSDVALLKRFRKTPDWLGHLLGVKLAERVTGVAPFRWTVSQLGDWAPVVALSPRRRGRWAVENASRFPRAAGGCRAGERGRQPSAGRQTAGRGDGGPGEEGAFSAALALRPAARTQRDSGTRSPNAAAASYTSLLRIRRPIAEPRSAS